ncbi:MAG: ATP-binding protein [Myxococcales bacterium]|nr:ATP-binding protein [Myxococcales bacterium]
MASELEERDPGVATGELSPSRPVSEPARRREEGEGRSSGMQACVEAADAPAAVPSDQQLLDALLAIDRRLEAAESSAEVASIHLDLLEPLLVGWRLTFYLFGGEETGVLAIRRYESPLAVHRLALHEALWTQSGIPEGRLPLAIELDEAPRPGGAGSIDGLALDHFEPIGLLRAAGPGTPGADWRARVHSLASRIGQAIGRFRRQQRSRNRLDALERLLRSANTPIAIIGPDRGLRLVSEALLSITGRERADVIGSDFMTLLPESDRPRIDPAFAGAMLGRPTRDLEVEIRRPDGSHSRICLNVNSVLDADGGVQGVIAIGRDLTEIRHLEGQVIQAEKLATLGQLAAGVVHELNNPLTSISVYGEYLLNKSVASAAPEGDTEKLRRIVQSTERILRFTRDLVVYARPTTEAPKALSIADIVEQSVVFCEHVLAEHGAVVVQEHADRSLTVLGVRGQLHQVFINLITNACHAMPHGAGKLSIKTEREASIVLITVHDNGAGIPAEQQAGIFEPFFSTKGEGKGTGLGLSIARNIVQQHGGTIDVTSELGDGASFQLAFPIL